ncbi:MAG TPA: ABC transporter permease [Burkholderiaceae bacterium]|nr:ABC transporter permease [Burkholderiaceae bacterium]
MSVPLSPVRSKSALTVEQRHRRMRWLVGGGLVVVLVAFWYLATGPLELVAPIKFPSIPDAYAAFRLALSPGYAGSTLLAHVGSSLGLVLLGFAAAILTGVPLGLLMGWNRMADAYLNPIFQIMRPIAPIAWIPLTILWFGLGISAKVFVIWLAAFSPALINTHTGIRNINPVLVEAARVHGASTWQLLRDVVIPNALPTIFTGLRISLQACWMVLVAAELVGSFMGLGYIMINATRDLDPSMIFVAMVTVALLGVLMNAALTVIERRVMPWKR